MGEELKHGIPGSVYNALLTIEGFCKNKLYCTSCPLSNDETDKDVICKLHNNTPAEWEIEREFHPTAGTEAQKAESVEKPEKSINIENVNIFLNC